MMNPDTPNIRFPPYISIPNNSPRDELNATPNTKDSNKMAKYSTTMYSNLTEAETQQPEVPGALNNDQTKFFQPIIVAQHQDPQAQIIQHRTTQPDH